MKTSFGINIEEYYNRLDKSTSKAAYYLNKGQLGLLLGAGLSMRELNFPGWSNLVMACLSRKFPTETFTPTNDPATLKDYAQKIKDKCADVNEYLSLVSEELYKDVKLEFDLAKRDIIVAVTALMVGKVRGNVRDIITYNFDSVLEWYLKINGLGVNNVTLDPLESNPADVNIIHLHGFLPHDLKEYDRSKDIVFSSEEFESRMIGNSYWKHLMYEFYKNHIFLSIGLGPGSLIKDVIPYLKYLDEEFYNSRDRADRSHPFGIAFVTECDDAQKAKLIENGIIPCVITRNNITDAVFGVARGAIK